MDTEQLKKKAGEKAAERLKNGMLVGLGTGSTVFYFIERLIEKCKAGLSVTIVSSSNRSLDQAMQARVPLADMDQVTHVDMTVDGADEIDSQRWMIKGGGGALLREKILAAMSKEIVIIVDDSKIVDKLGKHPLPVEILPFGHLATIDQMHLLGYEGELRLFEGGKPYLTDNGNYIYDIHFQGLRTDPKKDHEKLIHIPGVLETGFFFDLPIEIFVAQSDGRIKQL